MQLSKHLVLCRYILKQFGFDDFEELRDGLSAVKPGYDATGRSYFSGYLLGRSRTIDDSTLLRYDETIKGYEERLGNTGPNPSSPSNIFNTWPSCSPSSISTRSTPTKTPLSCP
jgi:hypothetical protein